MPSIELFVSLLPPFVFVIFSIPLFSLFLLFTPKAFVRPNRAPTMHTTSNMYVHYTWGLLVQKIIIIIFRALSSPHTRIFLVCTFSLPLYALI